MSRNPKLGMSQLELMMALAIMAMMATLLGSSFDLVRRAKEASGDIDADIAVIVARERLRSWAQEMPLIAEIPEGAAYFEGGSNSLSFTTIVSDGTFWMGGLIVVQVSRSRSDQAVRMVVRGRHPVRDEIRVLENQLSNKADDLKIDYYGQLKSDNAPRWHKEWSDGRNLPRLVKLSIGRSDGRSYPPITFQPAKVELHKYISLSSLVPPI